MLVTWAEAFGKSAFMAVGIDGKAVSEQVKVSVLLEATRFRQEHGRAPSLHVILVGDDPASAVYVRNKEASAEKAGIAGTVHRLPASTTESDLLGLVAELCTRDDVDGLLVQFPVPPHISQTKVIQTIHPSRDVDGLHQVNVGRLWSGVPGLVSCTPAGCLELLKSLGVQLRGRHAVVVGRSQLVGRPIAALLLDQDCTVTIAHSRTQDLAQVCRTADILVAAVGRPQMITAEHVKLGAIVIDVGINRLPDGRLVGDVDFESVTPIASHITPVPGGVGPMTIAMLLKNTVQAAFMRQTSAD